MQRKKSPPKSKPRATNQASSSRKEQLDTSALTGLRGIVVLHIALGHFLIPFELDLMGGASMGLFYSLSGFVLTLGHGKTLQPNGFASFIFKRWVRVGPLFLLTNAVSAFRLRASWNGTLTTQAFLTLTFLTSWCTALTVTPTALTCPQAATEPFNGVTWSTSTMFWFYVAFPWLMPRLQRVRPEALRGLMLSMYCLQAAGMAAAYSLGGEQSIALARMFPPLRLPVFVMGCCAALERLHAAGAHPFHTPPSSRTPRPRTRATNATKLVLLWAGLMIVAVAGSRSLVWTGLEGQWWGRYRLGLEMVFPVLFYHVLIALTVERSEEAAAAAPAVIAFLKHGAFQELGQVSMSFFLVHELCQEFAYAQAAAAGWIPSVDIHGDAGMPYDKEPNLRLLVLVGVVCPLALSLMLGWGLTRAVEKPLTRRLLSLLSPGAER